MKIQVIGLQRSGTNYLESLMRLNFKENHVVNGSREFSFKHGMPREKYVSEIGQFDMFNIDNIQKGKPYIILIKKKFLVWKDSIDRNPEDLYMKRPKLKTKELSLFHYTFYDEWERELTNSNVDFITIDYLDLLTDLQGTLERIKIHFELVHEGEYVNTGKVKMSAPFSEKDRKLYIKKYKDYENRRNN